MVPYFGYARQELRAAEGECRSAQVAARLLAEVGLDHLITVDLHSPALESALRMPVTRLSAEELFLPRIESWNLTAVTVVSPDAGGLKRAQSYASRLNAPLAVAAKHRTAADRPHLTSIIGDVKGRDCLLVDDMVTTANTLVQAAEALTAAGARSVSAAVTHPVLSGDATTRLKRSPIERLVVTDSIPDRLPAQAEIVSLVPLLANAVKEVVLA